MVETTDRMNTTILDLAVRKQQGVAKYMLENRGNLRINIVIYWLEILTDDSQLSGVGVGIELLVSLLQPKNKELSPFLLFFMGLSFSRGSWKKDD